MHQVENQGFKWGHTEKGGSVGQGSIKRNNSKEVSEYSVSGGPGSWLAGVMQAWVLCVVAVEMG